MSMTREEAIELKAAVGRLMYSNNKDVRDYNALIDFIESALRPVSREKVEKFKEYFDDLYGKGLEVYGWHMNGEAKSFDDFYEDACEYAGL